MKLDALVTTAAVCASKSAPPEKFDADIWRRGRHDEISAVLGGLPAHALKRNCD